MDYENLHKETLAALQQMVSEGKITEEIARRICADFVKEDEDEGIRKAIIELVKQSSDILNPMNQKSMIAWLEKQGEKNLSTDFSDLRTWKYIVDAVWTEKEGIGQYLDSPFTEETAKKLQKRFGNIEQKPAFCHHEVDFSGCSEEYRKAYYDGWNNCNQQHDQLEAEQKPAWSEEDDDNIMMIEDRLSDYLDYIREGSTLTKFQKNCLKEKVIGYVNWLKSLKERIGE